jgi:hypothetical protein
LDHLQSAFSPFLNLLLLRLKSLSFRTFSSSSGFGSNLLTPSKFGLWTGDKPWAFVAIGNPSTAALGTVG